MIKYEVNEDKRTVVAYFDKDSEEQMRILSREIEDVFNDYNYMGNNNGDRFVEISIFGEYRLARKIMKGFGKFVGVAKCHPDDTFDVEKGKLVARDRLCHKWIKFKDRVILQVIKDMDKAHAAIKYGLVKKIYFKCELLEDI